METDRIANRYSALLHQSKWGDSPTRIEKLREKIRKQGNGITLNRQNRETIGDDNGDVARSRLKLRNRVGMEGPAENRLAEVSSAVGGVGLEQQDGNGGFSKDGQFRVKALRKRG